MNRNRFAAPLLLLAIVAAGAVPALATRGSTRTASVALPPESTAAAKATCPKGSHSTSGGFRVSPAGQPGGGFQSVTQGSIRRQRRGWRVTSGAESWNPPATLTAFVRCERRIDSRIAGHLVGGATIAPGTSTPFNFNCPPGTRPVGAGWSVNNQFNGDPSASSNLVVVENRRRSRRVWRLTALVRNGASQPTTFTGSVPCERVTRRRIIQRSRFVPIGENQRAGATATCPKGTHLVSGGFAITPLPPGTVPFAVIDRHQPLSSRRWRVELYDTVLALPAGSALTTYAYCRRNRLPRRRSTASGAAASASPAFRGGSVTVGRPLRLAP